MFRECTAPCSTSRGTGSSSSGLMRGAASPDSSQFLIYRGTAASLRNMMGVFPLANTMSFFSNSPRSGGDSRAPVKDRTDEVWWHEPTTNPLRNVVPAHSPIHIDYSHASTQRHGADRSPRAPGDTSGEAGSLVPHIRPMDRPLRLCPPVATSRMPGPSYQTACMRHSSPVAAPAVLVFAAGGTRMQ